jgi:hypothetical protein
MIFVSCAGIQVVRGRKTREWRQEKICDLLQVLYFHKSLASVGVKHRFCLNRRYKRIFLKNSVALDVSVSQTAPFETGS